MQVKNLQKFLGKLGRASFISEFNDKKFIVFMDEEEVFWSIGYDKKRSLYPYNIYNESTKKIETTLSYAELKMFIENIFKK